MDKKTPTPEELEAALGFIQEVFDRALCPFFPLAETAWAIKHNEHLKGDGIYIGVQKKHLDPAMVIFPEAVRLQGGDNIDIKPKKIHIDYKGVPIEIRIISRHYRVLDFLDPVQYGYLDEFYLPNPFEPFWRMYRHMS